MLSFDDVIPSLVRICEQEANFTALKRACVVRDLKGRVRLVIEPRDGEPDVDIDGLETRLSDELGGYLASPILSTRGSKETARLANNLFDRAQNWPSSWPDSYEHPITGTSTPLTGNLWSAYQRFLAKETWLEPQQVTAPWPLITKAPAIISFYSFKGGVGRTLLVGAMAWHLAREGKRVAVLDLDLEAPGLSVLLSGGGSRGILDFIIDHIATGKTSALSDYHGAASALGDNDGGNIDVFSAGRMNWEYLEKLARLDFAAVGPDDHRESPTSAALGALLREIKRELQPDFILLDSRSGLHDLGGLSLHALSHVDVLVARAGEQNYQGLSLTLQALERRRAKDDFRCVIAHTMAPLREDSPLGREERLLFRERCHQLFSEHVYPSIFTEDDIPAVEGQDAHFPYVVPYHPELERIPELGSKLEPVIFSESFTALRHRILELCVREEEQQADG